MPRSSRRVYEIAEDELPLTRAKLPRALAAERYGRVVRQSKRRRETAQLKRIAAVAHSRYWCAAARGIGSIVACIVLTVVVIFIIY